MRLWIMWINMMQTLARVPSSDDIESACMIETDLKKAFVKGNAEIW